MKKGVKIILVVLAVLVLSGLALKAVSNKKVSSEPGAESATLDSNSIVYFYGEKCSHCQDVLKFLEDNKIAEKVDFSKREVWSNKENIPLFEQAIEKCGLATESVGVPFLFARGKCLIGTPDVEGFFKQEAGL